MKWRNDGRNNYTSYAFINDKPVHFEVMEDGHYIGMITNASTAIGVNDSTPEIYLSGYCNSAKEAIEFIEEYTNKETKSVKLQKTERSKERILNSDHIKAIIKEVTDGNAEYQEITLKNDNPAYVMKYTMNGKPVITTSKIYKEPFTMYKGQQLKVVAFLNKEPFDSFETII